VCVCVCIYICIYEKGFPPFFFSLFTSTPKPKACSIHPLSKKGERRLANLRFYAPGLFAVDVCERNNISAAFFSLSFFFFFVSICCRDHYNIQHHKIHTVSEPTKRLSNWSLSRLHVRFYLLSTQVLTIWYYKF